MDSTYSRYVVIWLFQNLPFYSLDYLQVIRSWGGGSENFFSLLWTSHISSYANLEDHLVIVEPPLPLREQLQHSQSNPNGSFTSLFTDFLKGSGIPCPALFDDAKNHFNKIIDLRQADAEGFRAKMFCWAVTGSCDREQGAPDIKVSGAELYTWLFVDKFGWTSGSLCR